MATLLQISKVKYLIDENSDECDSLANLYFCMYCLSLRSADVLQHEIDSHFCPQTLDSLSPAEAPLKRNKSANSWQCPACLHPLSTRATSTAIQVTDDPTKSTAKKVYYQACTFCRWSTRGIGMPDKDIVNGAWTEKANPDVQRVNQLLEYYKYVAQQEKLDQETKRSSKKRGYFAVAMQLNKYGGARLGIGGKKPSPLTQVSSKLGESPSLKEVTIEPAKTYALEDLEPLPEDIYHKVVNFAKVSSVTQRHSHPEHQSESVNDFWPQKTRMFIKQSLRCKGCDHNIIKPEYNASSIKFKIHLVAVNQIPEIRINKVPKLVPGESCKIILTLVNPTEHVLHVTLLPHIEEEKTQRSNCQVELPTSDLVLSKYDEAAEFIAPEGGQAQFEDDPEVIAYRRGNRIGFYLQCTPDKDLQHGDEVWVTFKYKHEHYGNTTIVALLKGDKQQGEPEADWLKQTVFVNVGRISSS
uniref:Dynactin subunit 4 n=1 Tax=Phallusia mammillata TaxID=59560 RepID=A0A6F9DB64_9ASCI|nr:dynactin subunit 4 [Phallusia mammillata]